MRFPSDGQALCNEGGAVQPSTFKVVSEVLEIPMLKVVTKGFESRVPRAAPLDDGSPWAGSGVVPCASSTSDDPVDALRVVAD